MSQILHRLTSKNSVIEVHKDKIIFNGHPVYNNYFGRKTKRIIELPIHLITDIYFVEPTFFKSARIYIANPFLDEFYVDLLRDKKKLLIAQKMVQTIKKLKEESDGLENDASGFRLLFKTNSADIIDLVPDKGVYTLSLGKEDGLKRIEAHSEDGKTMDYEITQKDTEMVAMLGKGLIVKTKIGEIVETGKPHIYWVEVVCDNKDSDKLQ